MGSISIVVLQLVVTRELGLSAAGVFAFAFSLGLQFQMLGAFEVRPFHATDVHGQFSFGTYHAARLVTTSLMVVGILSYTIASARPLREALVIMLVGLLRVFDAFEDVFYGEFQRLGRLDIAGRAFFFRTMVTTVAFTATAFLTRDLVTTCLVTIALSAIALVAFIVPPSRGIIPFRPRFDTASILQLLKACWPLFIASFLAMYLANGPRFGIERYLTDADQAYYAVLFMPAQAINVLSLFIFRPLLTRMANRWAENERRGFLTLVAGGMGGALGAFVLIFMAAWALGLQLIGLLYNLDLGGYLIELLVLVAGGALNAIGVILYYALVTLRRRRTILVNYVAASVVVTALCWFLIPSLGLLGACLAYTGAMLVFAVLAGLSLVSSVRAEPISRPAS